MTRQRTFSSEEFSAATKLDKKEHYSLVGTKQSLVADADLLDEFEGVQNDLSVVASPKAKNCTNAEERRQRDSSKFAALQEKKNALRERENDKKVRQQKERGNRDRKMSE